MNTSKAIEVRNDKLIKAKKDLARRSLCFSRAFSTPDGIEVLERLKQEFDPTVLCSEDQFQTTVRSAQRDVIRYIEAMIKLREE